MANTIARAKLYPGTLGSRQIAGAAPPGWSPISVSAPFWFDASDASTFTLSGSNVTQWRDKSGHIKNLSKQSGTLDAVRVAAVKNGLAGVRCDISGSNGSVLETSLPITLNQPNTIVMAIVGGPAFITPANATMWMVVGTADQAILLSSFSPSLYAGVNVVAFGAIEATNNTAYTYYGQFNGASSHGGVNGADMGPFNPGAGNINGNIQIGRSGSGLQFNGYMLEIFGFAGVNSTNLSDALTYINTKWGPF